MSPTWFLRLGLGITYLYSGYDLVIHPSAWHWAIRGLPLFIQQIIDSMGVNFYLRLQGSLELLFAAVLLLWFLPYSLARIVSLLIVAEMAGILLFVGVDPITFRDFAILGAAAALFFYCKSNPNE